ncbi:MAG TPA: hypothetical protein VGX23_26370 [Actinocrinis sp.]|nr:hypothetical protein [Actinocrinis sp.]
MIRTFLAAAATTVATTALVLAATGPAVAAAAPVRAAAPAACVTTAAITVNSFSFNPAQVVPGQSSTANLYTTNCTGVTQATQETWTGQYLSASGAGLPSGCPVIDPLLRPVTYAPYQAVLTSTSYLVLSGCTANALKVTVRITGTGGVLINQASATLAIKQ